MKGIHVGVPDDFPLWLERKTVPSMTWGTDHGEEAVFVLSGDLGFRVAIVEAGVPFRVDGDAEVLVMGRRDGSISGGETVHVVGDAGRWANVEPGRDTRYYADSSCPTCDVTLFTTGRDDAHTSAPHSHSSDELIHVLDGELVLGSLHVRAGETLAIAGGQRYGFRTTGAFRFLNYRPCAATMTRDGVTIEEGPLAHGFERVA